MGPGPAGIAQLEYMFSRIVCTSVPLGFIALLVILVIAGIKYLTSGGEPKAVQAAHQTVTWGLLGIVFLALAWLILQLIQNFTGVEVTKFSLSSLPGVQGFTGSCWSSPPIAPEPPPKIQRSITKLQASCTEIPGFGFPVTRCLIACSNQDEFLTQAPFNVANITYSSFNDPGLSEVIDEPIYVNLLNGAVDNTLWYNKKLDPWNVAVDEDYLEVLQRSPDVFKQTALSISRNEMTSLAGSLYGKFQKGELPSEFIRARHDANTFGYKLYEKRYGVNLISPPVEIRGYSCRDYDYYLLRTYSPLLYLYPIIETAVSIKIDSSIISNIALDNNYLWHIKAYPDGILLGTNEEKLRFIPYEFLRRDFRRPEQGFVVDKEHFAGFLKDNLWKSLGLTDTEVADYWKDLEWRIPESPYYFISLIDRSEIDRVLPMEVNPKPDTIIRNMTYILPIDKPFIPMPIKIKAPDRNGFTVLENGGFIDGF